MKNCPWCHNEVEDEKANLIRIDGDAVICSLDFIDGYVKLFNIVNNPTGHSVRFDHATGLFHSERIDPIPGNMHYKLEELKKELLEEKPKFRTSFERNAWTNAVTLLVSSINKKLMECIP